MWKSYRWDSGQTLAVWVTHDMSLMTDQTNLVNQRNCSHGGWCSACYLWRTRSVEVAEPDILLRFRDFSALGPSRELKFCRDVQDHVPHKGM